MGKNNKGVLIVADLSAITSAFTKGDTDMVTRLVRDAADQGMGANETYISGLTARPVGR